jgi:single stranded DNA-binding protein
MNELVAALLRASQHRFIGRLARDPETRFFDSGNSVTTARILINKPGAKRDDGQEPDGFKVEIWGDRGQAFADQCSKGQLVDVTGRVKTETWTDRNTGEKRQALTITAESWAPVATAGGNGTAAPAAAPAPAAAAAPAWNTAPLADEDDDLPF